MAAKNIYKVLKEIKFNLNFLIWFNSFITALIVYLFIYLLLSLFNFFPIFAIVPALMFFIVLIYLRASRSKPKIIESKYDKLKEKLRTALDYWNVENPVVNELHEEVIADMKKVSLSSFFNQRRIFLKIFIIIILCFAIVSFSVFNIMIADIGSVVKRISEKPELADFEKFESEVLSNMFGDSSIAKLGDEEINIEIKTSTFEVDVRQIGDIPQQTFDETFPNEVFVTGAEKFEENIGFEEQELVKNYFKRLYGE